MLGEFFRGFFGEVQGGLGKFGGLRKFREKFFGEVSGFLSLSV